MNLDRFEQLCIWTDESIRLCKDLMDLFGRERLALVQMKADELTETTMSKEVCVRKILELRKQIRESVRGWFGVESSEDLERHLLEQQRPLWATKHAEWKAHWQGVQELAQSSRLLLEHSQRNLGRLIDHWKRLIGHAPLYSAQGKKVDSESTGRVLEAKY